MKFDNTQLGVLVGSQSGQYGPDEVIWFALRHGWEWPDDVPEKDRESILARAMFWDSNVEPYEHVLELCDEVVDWLNDHTTEGISFAWHEGSFMLLDDGLWEMVL